MFRIFLFSVLLASVLGLPAQELVAGVRSKPVSIIYDTKSIIVNPRDSLSLDCGVSGDFRYCHWEKGPSQVLQVQDVHDGLLEGLRKPDIIEGNECGIVINSVTTEDHGQWTCKVFVVGNTLTGTKNVTVTIQPTSPILEVSNRPLIVNEGDQEQVTCSVAAARPQASIKWYLGQEDVTYNSHTENSLTDNMGTYKSISTLDHVYKAWDNDKPLRCSVTHYTLDLPMEDYVDISVNYKPWGQDESLYGIRLGDDVEATVDFSSNPSPLDVKWGYGPSFEEIQAVLPVPGEEGRYSTEVISLDEGHYTVILRVLEFTEMDSKMYFKVAVTNELGVRDFKVTLSNSKPPNEPLSNGTLVSIVLVVVFIILLLACTCYMKLSHKYCFAKKSEEPKPENGANSDTESAKDSAKPKVSIFSKLQGSLQGKPKSGKSKKGETNGVALENGASENGNTNEVVYAELSLTPGSTETSTPTAPTTKTSPPPAPKDGPPPNAAEDGTEYASIVGVIKKGDGTK